MTIFLVKDIEGIILCPDVNVGSTNAIGTPIPGLLAMLALLSLPDFNAGKMIFNAVMFCRTSDGKEFFCSILVLLLLLSVF